MRGAWLLLRASWLNAASYRLSMLFSVAALTVSVVPLYFVANALQPVMANAIRYEGHQYFGFVLVGTIAFLFIPATVHSLPTAVSGGIASGHLEALFATPTSVPSVLAGLTSYGLLWTALRATLLLAAGALLGAVIRWDQLPLALLILLLIVLAYAPIGLIASAMVLAFRTTGPIPQVVTVASSLLGGVYFPTHVIPSWLESFAGFIPLTYGLRALRRVLLDGARFAGVASDIGVLLAMDVGLLAVGAWVFAAALRHARRSGSLSRY